MSYPNPTRIYRFIHIDNLTVVLTRAALHAPNHVPNDGLVYKTIHNVDIQAQRRVTAISCGPGGVIHDYVPFYFGPRTPMLYQLHTGWVAGYDEGQTPLIYLISSAQAVEAGGAHFVFSDGHGIAKFTDWFDELADLGKLDWTAIGARIWKDTVNNMDRQRRKQAEFLVHRVCPWQLVHEIAVINSAMKTNVEGILAGFPVGLRRPVRVRPDLYY